MPLGMINMKLFSGIDVFNLRKTTLRLTTSLLLLLPLEACGLADQISERFNGPEKKEPNPIWLASLDVLNFLPVKSAIAESGLIITGYGKPPGGDTEYRATILIVDNAIDASALKLALFTRDGPVDGQTLREIENSILIRARELHSLRNDSPN